jgi:predicted ATPase/DNA-binding winged helix-turn-helix (wHTH) protein
MGSASEPAASVGFGRFRVLPHRRELLADGQPIKLGGRAFDVLMALIEAGGAVVSKEELMARVWPNQIVEENNLQAQMSALRAALGPDRELIRTVARRGYQFTGEARSTPASPEEHVTGEVPSGRPVPVPSTTNLPEPVSELIGRDDELREILGLASAHRLVTLTGPGGIGKTRLALAIARRLLPQFADGVWVAELAPLADPSLVAVAVAGAAGLEFPGAISPERVADALSGQQLLVVLDNCEHVIDTAAMMAEALLRANPTAHVIATSREPLNAEGERVYPVPPLALPKAGDDPLGYGAVQLFFDRARAAEPHFAPDQRQAARIAAICRRLDGIPLAIELAASRVATLGIEQLAARLDDRFRVLTGGRRTALPRHQTLRATLDWSFGLLTETERVVLRRLAVIAGSFGLDAVSALVASPEIASPDAVEALSSLVTKSLVAVEADHTARRYRLLDTTRAYALEKLAESGERQPVARRHAEFARDVFERAQSEWEGRTTDEWRADYERRIDNLRAALDWAFSPEGDSSIGVALTIASERLWYSLSLIDEYHKRVALARSTLNPGVCGTTRHEMQLCAILSVVLFNTKGPGPEARAAWTEVLKIAERLEDTEYRLRALWGLWYNYISNAECQAALTLAERYSHPGDQVDPADLLIGERMLGTSLYYVGDLPNARYHLEHVLSGCAASLRRVHITRFQFDLPVATRGTLVRVLWLQGFPDQAMRMTKDNIEDARAIDDVVSLFWALDAACMVAIAVGDHATAERSAAMLLEHSAQHALGFWQALGHSYEGQVLIARGDVVTGVRALRTGLDELRETRYVLRSPALLGSLAEGMAAAGQLPPALLMIDEALARCEHTDERWSIAELLRVKGELLLLQDAQWSATEAEHHFRQALGWARRQAALSWELRVATSLARLLSNQRRAGEAIETLQPVYDRFTEGFDTTDLRSAKALLDALH